MLGLIFFFVLYEIDLNMVNNIVKGKIYLLEFLDGEEDLL